MSSVNGVICLYWRGESLSNKVLMLFIIRAVNQGDDNTNILLGNSTYDSYRAPSVVQIEMQSAEHIATAVNHK